MSAKSTSISILAAVGVALLSAPLAAQATDAKTGSRFKEDRFSSQEKRARIALNRFGHCVARVKSDEFVAFMNSRSSEAWEDVMYFPNGETRCLNEDMQSNTRTLQGAIAEGWYLSNYSKGMPSSLASYTPKLPPQAPAISRILSANDAAKPYVIVDEFAACVASAAPAPADAFLRTTVASDDEQAAFQELSPYLGPCAFDGQKLSFNMMGFRGAIAFALTELALDPTLHDADEG